MTDQELNIIQQRAESWMLSPLELKEDVTRLIAEVRQLKEEIAAMRGLVDLSSPE